MANHKSAIKRAKQSEIQKTRNKSIKSHIRSITKQIRLGVGNAEGRENMPEMASAQSFIDRAANKGVIHKRAAARRKSRLARMLNKLSQSA